MYLMKTFYLYLYNDRPRKNIVSKRHTQLEVKDRSIRLPRRTPRCYAKAKFVDLMLLLVLAVPPSPYALLHPLNFLHLREFQHRLYHPYLIFVSFFVFIFSSLLFCFSLFCLSKTSQPILLNDEKLGKKIVICKKNLRDFTIHVLATAVEYVMDFISSLIYGSNALGFTAPSELIKILINYF